MKMLLKALVLGFMAVFLLACSQSNSKESQNEKKQSKKPAQLVLTTVAIKSLDSVKATDSASFNIISNTQETLLIYNEGKPVAGAAKSFELSEDGLKYTFHLRDGLKWSDGKPLTSHDFKYAWSRLIDPNVGASYAFFLFGVKNANDFYLKKNGVKIEDVGFYTPDDKTFVVELAQPIPYFTQIAAFTGLSPQRKDIVEKYQDAYATKPDKMVYSGPFMVSDWVKGSKVELVKNPNFWDAKNIKLDEVKLLQVKEFSTQYQMFESGQLDIVEGNTGEFIQRYNKGAKAGKYKHIKIIVPREYYMSFNFKKPEFKSIKVRQAFSAALDRENFVNKILKSGVPAYGFVTPGILVGDIDYRKAVPQPLKTVKIADPKALLIEGLKDLGMDPDPKNHNFQFLQRKSDAQMKIEGEYLKDMWEKSLGVSIELLPAADFADFLDKDSKGLFDISYQGWGADYNSPLTFLDYYTTWNGYNTGKYKNEEVDKLIKQAQGENDPNKRIELFKKVEEIYLVSDPATAPLYYKDANSYMKNFVHGVQLTLFGGKYQLRWASVDPH